MNSIDQTVCRRLAKLYAVRDDRAFLAIPRRFILMALAIAVSRGLRPARPAVKA